MEGTNTYMPVMPAGYGGGFGDGMGSGWWIILLFLFMGFGGGGFGYGNNGAAVGADVFIAHHLPLDETQACAFV